MTNDPTQEQLIAEIVALRSELETLKQANESCLQVQLFNVLEEIFNEIYIFDAASLHFEYVNTAARRNIGYTLEQLQSLTPVDIQLEQDERSFRQRIDPLLHREQEKLIFETVHKRADGTYYPVEVHLQLIEYDKRSVFLAVILDITERKQAQAALRKAKDELEMRVAERTAELISVNRRLQLELDERTLIEEALRGSQDRFAGILEIAEDAIISIDASQRITLFNQGAEKIFGYTAQEVLGQPLDLLLPVRFTAMHRQHVADFAQSTSRARRMGERREIFARHKDGMEFPAEASISKLELAGETIFTVILRDITERHQVERMKDEFVSVVSHELRTPLTSIHGSLGMLASGLLKAQPEKAQRLLQIAVESTERLVRLINDILDIERIESGKVKMEKQTCDAADLIGQAVEVMQPMADKAKIALSVTTVWATLRADPDRIVQTLTNLLSNAIKFSPPGATVWLSAEIQPESEEFLSSDPLPLRSFANIKQKILFKVEDKGRGIPADKLETIFERFQQVDASDSRKNEGTGLGLAICRSIVQQHGGQIWVESVLGEGSIFYFTLPVESIGAEEQGGRGAEE